MFTELAMTANTWQHQRCAYQIAKPAMDALSANTLAEICVDIRQAANVVFGSLPKIVRLRATVASSLADFDMRAFDRLETYTRAMCYANWFHQSTLVSADRLEGWLDQLPTIRRRLIVEASRTFPGGEFHRFSIAPCPQGLRSHMELEKFLRLCCFLRQFGNRCEGTTNLWDCEIAQGELLTDLFDLADEQAGDFYAVQSIAATNRQRAYTLFLRSYDQVRRAIQFVRWNNGDADEIAPALVSLPARRRLYSWLPASGKLPILKLESTALPRAATSERAAC